MLPLLGLSSTWLGEHTTNAIWTVFHSILLYVKVGERAVVKDAVCDWLHCSGNMSQSGFSSVAELYFLHILVPMGLTAEALEMLETDVGRVAFTDEQRQAARSLVDSQNEKNAASSSTNPESVAVTTTSASKPGDFLLLMRLK